MWSYRRKCYMCQALDYVGFRTAAISFLWHGQGVVDWVVVWRAQTRHQATEIWHNCKRFSHIGLCSAKNYSNVHLCSCSSHVYVKTVPVLTKSDNTADWLVTERRRAHEEYVHGELGVDAEVCLRLCVLCRPEAVGLLPAERARQWSLVVKTLQVAWWDSKPFWWQWWRSWRCSYASLVMTRTITRIDSDDFPMSSLLWRWWIVANNGTDNAM